MQERFVRAVSAALIMCSLATPALASAKEHGNGNGNAFGKKVSAMAKEKKGDAWSRRHDDAKSVCVETAHDTYEAAVKAARAAYRDAIEDARDDFHDAYKSANTAREAAKKAAREAYNASAKDEAARAAFKTAKESARATWLAAIKTAKTAYNAKKETAMAAFKTAKESAMTAYKAAKASCVSTTPAPTPTADTTAPAAVTNLALSAATTSSVLVSWTAPGDDGSTGTATTYDLRYSTSPITTDAAFNAATAVTGEPTPMAAGSAQSKTVTGLTAGTTYHFALKTLDEVPNISALSNNPSLATLAADTTAPAAITNLSLSVPSASSMLVGWTAPGDDGSTGTAATYDLRYSTSPITTDAAFNAATTVASEPTPAVAGTTQSMTVSGLTAGTTYYFAIKAMDEVPNISALSNNPSLATL